MSSRNAYLSAEERARRSAHLARPRRGGAARSPPGERDARALERVASARVRRARGRRPSTTSRRRDADTLAPLADRRRRRARRSPWRAASARRASSTTSCSARTPAARDRSRVMTVPARGTCANGSRRDDRQRDGSWCSRGSTAPGRRRRSRASRRACARRGVPVRTTREPSDGPDRHARPPGAHRAHRRARAAARPGWATMALLFAADRMDHVESEIEPFVARAASSSPIATTPRASPTRASRAAPRRRRPSSGSARSTATRAGPISRSCSTSRPSSPPSGATQRGEAAQLYEQNEVQRALAVFYRDLAKHMPDDRIVIVDARGRSTRSTSASGRPTRRRSPADRSGRAGEVDRDAPPLVNAYPHAAPPAGSRTSPSRGIHSRERLAAGPRTAARPLLVGPSARTTGRSSGADPATGAGALARSLGPQRSPRTHARKRASRRAGDSSRGPPRRSPHVPRCTMALTGLAAVSVRAPLDIELGVAPDEDQDEVESVTLEHGEGTVRGRAAHDALRAVVEALRSRRAASSPSSTASRTTARATASSPSGSSRAASPSTRSTCAVTPAAGGRARGSTAFDDYLGDLDAVRPVRPRPRGRARRCSSTVTGMGGSIAALWQLETRGVRSRGSCSAGAALQPRPDAPPRRARRGCSPPSRRARASCSSTSGAISRDRGTVEDALRDALVAPARPPRRARPRSCSTRWSASTRARRSSTVPLLVDARLGRRRERSRGEPAAGRPRRQRRQAALRCTTGWRTTSCTSPSGRGSRATWPSG